MRRTVALALLVEDFELYPRHKVDGMHVADLFRALQGGAELPRVVVEAKSLRIIDGFHRVRALKRYHGESAELSVETRSYKTEADVFAEAVRLNARHGRRLDRHDQVRIAIRFSELGIAEKDVAVILGTTEPRIQELTVRIVKDHAGHVHASKCGFEHLQGRRLSRSQLAVISSTRSGEVPRLCRELSGILREDLADLDSGPVRDALEDLRAVLDESLGRRRRRKAS